MNTLPHLGADTCGFALHTYTNSLIILRSRTSRWGEIKIILFGLSITWKQDAERYLLAMEISRQRAAKSY